MRFSFAGTGNIAHHFCVMLKMHGHQLHQLYARDPEKGFAFCEIHGGSYIGNAANFSRDNDFVFIATSDGSIKEIAEKIDPSITTVHFSGNTSVNVLTQSKKAVIWPVYSFAKSKKIEYRDIPLVIEASDQETYLRLERVFGMITAEIYHAGLDERQKLHLAAVFANNFTTRLYEIAQDLATQTSIPPRVLQPMIDDLVQHLHNIAASELQTGPARRADYQTLKRQLSMLDHQQDYQLIYAVITNSILKKYHGIEL